VRRRANAQLPDKLVALLESLGERRIVAEGSVVVQAVRAPLAAIRRAEAREPATV
jgi:hypothetical protein